MKLVTTLVAVLGLLSFVGCGGGDGGSSSNASSNVGPMVLQLIALNQQYMRGGVTVDEYTIQGANIMAAIDHLPGGPAELESYLRTEVTGKVWAYGGPLGWTVSLPQVFSNLQAAVTYLETSSAHENFKRWAGYMILFVTEQTGGLAVAVANPEAVKAILTFVYAVQIQVALVSGSITMDQYAELRRLLEAGNPVGAHVRLLQMTDQPVPDVFSHYGTSIPPVTIRQAPLREENPPNSTGMYRLYEGEQEVSVTCCYGERCGHAVVRVPMALVVGPDGRLTQMPGLYQDGSSFRFGDEGCTWEGTILGESLIEGTIHGATPSCEFTGDFILVKTRQGATLPPNVAPPSPPTGLH